jgi:hypothetical protein
MMRSRRPNAACATPYQPMSTLGGYREIQLTSNTYRVMFFGNGYTYAELAVEYALCRCVELTQQNGYRYLGILAVNDFGEQRSWKIPRLSVHNGHFVRELIREHGVRELQSDGIHYPSADNTIQFPAPRDHHANGQ